jgi:hypothetical protein
MLELQRHHDTVYLNQQFVPLGPPNQSVSFQGGLELITLAVYHGDVGDTVKSAYLVPPAVGK